MKQYLENFCAIISGGEYSKPLFIENASYIIACDKGYINAKKASIIPNLVIGDFDSYTKELPKSIDKITLPKIKDDTDTLYALKYAIKNKYKNIVLYSALGGKIDHLLANIQLGIFACKHNCKLCIIDDEYKLFFLSNSFIEINYDILSDFSKTKKSNTFSVLCLTDETKNVTIKNAKYNLQNYTLTNSFPLGISNEFINNENVFISCQNGVLLVIV